MKKLLLGTVAIIGLAAVSAPALAGDGVSLDIGGHFKGYTTWHDQDETVGLEARTFDILRETEIHFSGETTLDNGLTVGVHVEADVDGGDGFNVDESYAYFSGAWGRVNFGDEDGAAYLLQVAAPSADSNVDGIRQYVNPVNYNLTSLNGTANETIIQLFGLDYGNDLANNADKITYLSPVINGFQGGFSYTPDVGAGFAAVVGASRSLGGVNPDNVEDSLGEALEVAIRWEGNMDELGVILGAGFTNVDFEADADNSVDDLDQWNVGVDFDWGAFGLGVIYTEHNNAENTLDENETWVVGVDYTTGPFKIGGSYFNNENNIDGVGSEVDTDRWTGGVVYTYGPGMTFRGSLSYVDHSVNGAADVDATSVLLGTQINF